MSQIVTSNITEEEDFDWNELEHTGVGGNQNLKPAGTTIDWQPWMLEEYMRCQTDPIYFCENYVKIISLDEGIVPFKMFEYQKRFVKTAVANRFTIVRCGRQMGKTTTAVGLLLHEALFNKTGSAFIAILANKMDTAQEILERLQMAYELMPQWLQQGVVSWNKRSIVLENKTKIICAPTSSSSIRGKSISTLYLDEFAHIPPHIQLKFFTGTYPVISSGKHTKIIITSTPNGMELYYKLWTDSVKGRNSYKHVDIHWSEYPGRDETWKQQVIADTSEEQFRQEYEVEFLGSSNTLISPNVLQRLVYENPLVESNSARVYEEPVKNHIYTIMVDTARGVGGDASAFVVLDVSEVPYKVVSIFKDHLIEPQIYPRVIHQAHKKYNNAYILVETNDIGQSIAEALITDYENEFVLRVTSNGRKGQVLGGGFGGAKNTRVGLKTTAPTKRIGCLALKSLVENNKITINDYDIVSELSTFVSKGTSWEAEYGKHDDLVMCLVLFGWMSTQAYFKDLTDIDIRKNLVNERENYLEEEMLPFGIINDGFADSSNEIDEFYDPYGFFSSKEDLFF